MVSIIVPTYNRGNVIHRSIDSILNQTYKDFELLIVDDGSTDDTERVIQSYKDERVKYIYNDSDGHGPSQARNIGILHSSGQYMSFNDSDDEWHHDKLEKQLGFLETQGADVTFCMMRKRLGDKEAFIPDRKFSQDNCNLDSILESSFTGTPALFGKAECFKSSLFDEKITCNEDWELMIRLLDQYKVVYQNENLVEVSVTQQSVSSDHHNAITAMNYIMDKHCNLFDRHKKSLSGLKRRIQYQTVLCKDMEAADSFGKKKTLAGIMRWGVYRLKRYFYAVCFVLSR